DDQSARHCLFFDACMELECRIERLLAVPRSDQFDRLEQAASPNIADERMIGEPLADAAEKPRTPLTHVGAAFVALDPALHGECRRARGRVADVRVTMLKEARTFFERFDDLAPDQQRADRRVAAAEPLGDREKIWRDALLFAGVQRTRAA